MSIAGIVLALSLLIYLAYRGISVLVLAPLVAADPEKIAMVYRQQLAVLWAGGRAAARGR